MGGGRRGQPFRPGIPPGRRQNGWSRATSDADVKLYLSEISRYALLKPDEERALAKRVRQGDMEARNNMVRANLRLVVSIAKNYVDRGLSFLDLIEEGNLGLLKAVERFNPDEGCKFSTYASWWIKQTMRRALINKVKNVRVPAYMVETLSKWRKATQDLSQKFGREPSAEEVALEVGLSPEKLPILHRAILAHGSSVRMGEASFIQDIEDETALAPGGDDMAIDNTDGRPIEHALETVLSEREQLILRLRFGIGTDSEPCTLEQIGKRISLTRERVRQIEAQALRKLFCFLTGEKDRAGPVRNSASVRAALNRGSDSPSKSSSKPAKHSSRKASSSQTSKRGKSRSGGSPGRSRART